MEENSTGINGIDAKILHANSSITKMIAELVHIAITKLTDKKGWILVIIYG